MIQEILNKTSNKHNFYKILNISKEYNIDLNKLDNIVYPEIVICYDIDDLYTKTLEFDEFIFYIKGKEYHDPDTFFKNYKNIEKIETQDFIYTIKYNSYAHNSNDDYFTIEYDVHNEHGYALWDNQDKSGMYFIDGLILSNDKVKNFERKLKLERLIK